MLTIANPIENPLSETAVRKRATRRGLKVAKGKGAFGVGFMLVDRFNNGVIAGYDFDLSLAEVNAHIEAYRPV